MLHGRPAARSYYQALWNNHANVIDYVNLQFYAYGRNTTVDQYVSHYDEQTDNYRRGRVLAAINTSKPADVNIVDRDVALVACAVF